MSWDVMLFNFEGKPPVSISQLSDDFKPPLLGTADQVRQIISSHLSEVDWSDPTWGMLQGEGFSIEFSIGDKTQIDGMMLHVRGGGDALAAITKLCKRTGWSALDCSTMEFLDPLNPSPQGWESFQKYRDQVVGTPAASFECPNCKRRSGTSGKCSHCGS